MHARVSLRLLGEDRTFEVPVATEPQPMTSILTVARSLADQSAGIISDHFTRQGQAISCKSGCTACCHHVVALSELEALDIAAQVSALPAARQAEIRQRFAWAQERLAGAGLLEKGPPGMRSLTVEDQGDRQATVHELSRRYFKLQMPCPFLDDYRCSIYENRPAVCREHHVISPAENCAHPETEEVCRVEVRLDLTAALARMTANVTGQPPRTIPLILALEWAENNQLAQAITYPGKDLLSGLLDALDPTSSNPSAVVTSSGKRSPATVPVLPQTPTFVEKPETVVASIDLNVAGRRLKANIEVPTAPTPLIHLLPIARSLCNAATAAAVEDASAAGTPVRCAVGCAACCRHLVPLSPPEAQRLATLVEEAPAPRRAALRDRFAAVKQNLDAAGLLTLLQEPQTLVVGEPLPGARPYFALRIPCPFLENEVCSIYDERPLACREHMVVSPPDYCSNPVLGEMQAVRPSLAVAEALGKVATPREDGQLSWIPLPLCMDWVEANPEPPPRQSGPELLRTLFAELTGRRVAPLPDTERRVEDGRADDV